MLPPSAASVICRAGSSRRFDDITDYGKSGLVPLAARSAFRRARGVAADVDVVFAAGACGDHGAHRISVHGDRGTEPVCHHHQAHDRTRAARWSAAASIRFCSVHLKWHAAYAGMPSGHATTAFAVLVAFGTLWPRARTAVAGLCLADCGEPGGGDRALSERCAWPGRWSGSAARLWYGTILRSVGLGFAIGPDGTIHQYAGPSLRRIKAVARGLLAP